MPKSTIFSVLALVAAIGVGVFIAITPSHAPDDLPLPEDPVTSAPPTSTATDNPVGATPTVGEGVGAMGEGADDPDGPGGSLPPEMLESRDDIISGMAAALLQIDPLEQKVALVRQIPALRLDMTDERATALVTALQAMTDDEARNGVMMTIASARAVYAHPMIRDYIRAVEDPRMQAKVQGAEARLGDGSAVEFLIDTNIKRPDDEYKGVARFLKVVPVLIVNAAPESDEAIIESLGKMMKMISSSNGSVNLREQILPKITGIEPARRALYEGLLDDR